MDTQLEKIDSNKAAAMGGVLVAFLALVWLVRHFTK